MDDVITSIKEKVINLYADILTDLNIDDDYLSEMVKDVIDRALIFMNRDFLVEKYEEDLIDYPPTDTTNEDFWKGYEYPIPPRLYRVLARVVIQSCKTILDNNVNGGKEVSSISDNGQSISYKDSLAHFFNSSDDSKVFSGSLELLKNYRLASVPDETNFGLQNKYKENVL